MTSTRIDDSLLEQCCRQEPEVLTPYDAAEVVRALGPLARWWLRPQVIERARQDPRFAATAASRRPPVTCADLPAKRGSCWPLLVARRTGERHLLREALLLPLHWQPAQPHDPLLPEPFRLVAEDVLAQLRKVDALPGQFGLQLSAGIGGVDLRGLHDVGFRSAWPALAGPLLCYEQGQPDTRVWATGIWEPGAGVVRVDGVQEKARLAAEMGASVLFVPRVNQTQADFAVAGRRRGLRIEPFASPEPRPRNALARYLEHFGIDPDPKDFTDEAAYRQATIRRYWSLYDVTGDFPRTYYEGSMLEWIAREAAKTLRRPDGPLALVTIAGGQPELIELAGRILQPVFCQVLYTPQNETKAKEAASRLGAVLRLRDDAVPDPVAFPDDLDDTIGPLRGAVARAREEARKRGAALVLDVTPGKKLMTLAMADFAAEAGDWLFYAENERGDRNRISPHPVRARLWRPGASWEQSTVAAPGITSEAPPEGRTAPVPEEG